MGNSSPKFTYEEVSKHNIKEDLWVIVNKKVYNVTDFVWQHPGGKDPFLENAGTDVTHIFNMINQHNSKSIKKQLESLCIGKVKN